MIEFSAVLFAVVNLIAFCLYGVDKRKARKGSWRISEKTLLLWSVIAPFGAVFGTKFFHHKTKKLKFDIVLFISCTVQTVVIGTVINGLIQ